MRTIAAISMVICLLTGRASAATNLRDRCADAVGMAGSKLASVALKVMAQCHRDATCVSSDRSIPKGVARTLDKARQFAAGTIRRGCRSLPAEALPIAACPTRGEVVVDSVGTLVACVVGLVDDRTAALVGDLFGVQARCGDGRREGGEQCDGRDDSLCPGACTAGCTCPKQIGSCAGGPEPASCRTDADCGGRCNLNGEACLGDRDCEPDSCGRCTVTHETCSTDGDCARVNVCAVNVCLQNTCTDQCNAGLCATSFKPCAADADCPLLGYCQVSGDSCATNAECPTSKGSCAQTGDACRTDADCDRSVGACTQTNSPCATSADCAKNTCRPDVCRVSGRACAADADCVVHCVGRCGLAASLGRSLPCETRADCPSPNVCLLNAPFCFDGHCTSNGEACAANADCAATGACNYTGGACTSDADCPATSLADYCDFSCEGTSASCSTDADCTPRCSDPTPGFCVN